MGKAARLSLMAVGFCAGIAFAYACAGGSAGTSFAGVGDADTLDGLDSTAFAVAGHAHSAYAPVAHTHSAYALVAHTHPSGRFAGTTTADGARAMNPAVPDSHDVVVGSRLVKLELGSANQGWVYPLDRGDLAGAVDTRSSAELHVGHRHVLFARVELVPGSPPTAVLVEAPVTLWFTAVESAATVDP